MEIPTQTLDITPDSSTRIRKIAVVSWPMVRGRNRSEQGGREIYILGFGEVCVATITKSWLRCQWGWKTWFLNLEELQPPVIPAGETTQQFNVPQPSSCSCKTNLSPSSLLCFIIRPGLKWGKLMIMSAVFHLFWVAFLYGLAGEASPKILHLGSSFQLTCKEWFCKPGPFFYGFFFLLFCINLCIFSTSLHFRQERITLDFQICNE